MQEFTIRDIENLTGIKAHTLRIWEQRYDFFQPKRKESKHRFYDNDDLKQLLRISCLYNQGWKISRIATLTAEQVQEQVRNTSVPAAYSQYVFRLLEAALDFNEAAFQGALNEISSQIGFEKTVTEVCYPYLQKLGLLWSTNNVVPAQEHFSSYIIQNRIISETGRLPHHHTQPEILLICPQGEYHELPLLFINYLLRKNGRNTIYLGANITKEEILSIAQGTSIQYIYLHLITNFTGMFVDDYLETICTSFPGKKIVASGEGMRFVQRSFVNLQLLRNDRDIHAFIQELRYEHSS